jgi:arsenate reductase (thioredoxin)
VLFLCTHNAGRSQMALCFFQALVGDTDSHRLVRRLRTRTSGQLDISGEFPKPWTDETVRAAEVVISMGCGSSQRPRCRIRDTSGAR